MYRSYWSVLSKNIIFPIGLIIFLLPITYLLFLLKTEYQYHNDFDKFLLIFILFPAMPLIAILDKIRQVQNIMNHGSKIKGTISFIGWVHMRGYSVFCCSYWFNDGKNIIRRSIWFIWKSKLMKELKNREEITIFYNPKNPKLCFIEGEFR